MYNALSFDITGNPSVGMTVMHMSGGIEHENTAKE